MERFIFFQFFSICLIVLNSHSFAQSSASANITATIVNPIAIRHVPGKDLNFGNIAPSKSAGLVILGTNGVRRSQGGVILPTAGGNITPAEFLVMGESSFSFSISLPANPITMVNSATSETMSVENFTSTPETTGTLLSGQQTIKIGATLKVNANQSPGNYVSTSPLVVTVTYN